MSHPFLPELDKLVKQQLTAGVTWSVVGGIRLECDNPPDAGFIYRERATWHYISPTPSWA